MKKIFHLSSCSTCQQILKRLKLPLGMELIDIKLHTIDENTLDWLKKQTGSYESLFSKRAIKYKALPNKNLSEADYRQFLLNEYTFLKRPVIIYGDKVWVGNDKLTVKNLEEFFKMELD